MPDCVGISQSARTKAHVTLIKMNYLFVWRIYGLIVARLDVRFINHVMHLTRKHWSPQTGSGSQSAYMPGYRALITTMTVVLDEEEARIKAEDAEWEEDDSDTADGTTGIN